MSSSSSTQENLKIIAQKGGQVAKQERWWYAGKMELVMYVPDC